MAGFYVENGVLKEAGVPIKKFGLNVPDLFIEWMAGAANTTTPASPINYQTNYATNFAYLQSLGFRCLKFSLTGYHPVTFTAGWINNQATFLAKLDALVASAETYNMRLVPYLFGNLSQIPPCYGEHLRQISDPNSQTYAMMGNLITTIVNRYKGSPAIAMWAFATEADLHIQNSGQFDNTTTTTPDLAYSINTALGDPATWNDPLDCYTAETVMNAMTRFQTMVKSIDNAPVYPGKASRASCSGNGGAYAVKRVLPMGTFLQQRINSDVTDTLEIHPYPNTSSYYSVDLGTSYEIFLGALKNLALSNGKPMIIGEFGVPQNFSASMGDPRNFVQQQKRQITSIAAIEAQLSFIWNWPAVTGTDINWSLRADEPANNQGAILTWLSQFNTAYKNGY